MRTAIAHTVHGSPFDELIHVGMNILIVAAQRLANHYVQI